MLTPDLLPSISMNILLARMVFNIWDMGISPRLANFGDKFNFVNFRTTILSRFQLEFRSDLLILKIDCFGVHNDFIYERMIRLLFRPLTRTFNMQLYNRYYTLGN